MPVELPPLPMIAPDEADAPLREKRPETQSGLGALTPGRTPGSGERLAATSLEEALRQIHELESAHNDLRADLGWVVGEAKELRQLVQGMGASAMPLVEQQAQQLQQIQAACVEYRNAILALQQQLGVLSQQQAHAGWAFLALKTAAETRGPGDPPGAVKKHAEEYFEFLKKHSVLPLPLQPFAADNTASSATAAGAPEEPIALPGKPETKH